MVFKNSTKKRKMWKGAQLNKEKEKGRERERCCREALGSACLHLHTRCALPQLWNVFVRSSLTTDPPNHYHRNLIQAILSASFICVCVCVCVCVLLSVILLPLATFCLLIFWGLNL